MSKQSAAKKNTRILNANYKINGFDLQNLATNLKFSQSAEKNNMQIKMIEKDLNAWTENALSVFTNYNDPENKKEWDTAFKDIDEHFRSITQLLISTVSKIGEEVKTDHSLLWNAIESRINATTKTIKKMELISKDQMTDKDYVCFSNEIKHFDNIILAYITAFVALCKVQLG
jgi:hypothetical protein